MSKAKTFQMWIHQNFQTIRTTIFGLILLGLVIINALVLGAVYRQSSSIAIAQAAGKARGETILQVSKEVDTLVKEDTTNSMSNHDNLLRLQAYLKCTLVLPIDQRTDSAIGNCDKQGVQSDAPKASAQ